jgi:hypothetical protein
MQGKEPDTEPSPAREAAEALVWQFHEARTCSGDLYSVHRLSESVWQTCKNGTALSGWSPTKAEAQAKANAAFIARRA